MTIWSCCATWEELEKSNSPTNSKGVATHLKYRPLHPFAVTGTAFESLRLYFVFMHAHWSFDLSAAHFNEANQATSLLHASACKSLSTAPHPSQALPNVGSLSMIDYILAAWVLPNIKPGAGVWFLAWAHWLRQSCVLSCVICLKTVWKSYPEEYEWITEWMNNSAKYKGQMYLLATPFPNRLRQLTGCLRPAV